MEIVAGQGAVSFNQIQRPMEDSSSHPFEHDQTAPGASKFLSDLPSRGHLSSPIISSNLGVMQVYICEHNTSPPESQHIKTDQQNILIRSLMLNNNKGGSSSKDVKAAAEGPRKRAAEKVMDSSASAKKANTKNNSQSEGSSSSVAEKDYHSFTVERLRALLKERGLSPKGKKDELIARLKCVNESAE
ncbi:hypothetical protein ES319_A09G262900v1 [Gossypium barbadense]|uniref:SAP domain-containing protein n=3 Tax=Gossypium TaxID=3633 RepID=A0A5J5UJP5_GOSBA|nr:hypothetical protein ES319_A09G262900v1 [Gossypium barbadense]TYH04322.1 hypothetical protein ES288_A09G288900v1 [Gossypium darwinii]TYI12560.1 hypothetical protein ES332_A09G286000v1 [Gossypium tomentosum]